MSATGEPMDMPRNYTIRLRAGVLEGVNRAKLTAAYADYLLGKVSPKIGPLAVRERRARGMAEALLGLHADITRGRAAPQSWSQNRPTPAAGSAEREAPTPEEVAAIGTMVRFWYEEENGEDEPWYVATVREFVARQRAALRGEEVENG